MTNSVNKMRCITVRSYNVTATGESHDKTFPIFLQESNFQIRHVVQILVTFGFTANTCFFIVS